MEPVTSSSVSNTCPDPISSNCVTVSQSVPGVNGVCFPTNLTTVIQALGTTVVGNQSITGLQLGCLYSATIGTCPAGWTFVPASGSVAAHCSICSSDGCCPPNSSDPQPDGNGGVICTPCFPTPCPAPPVVYIPNPVPPPTTLIGILQLFANFLQPYCNCNPCSTNQNVKPGP